MNIIYLFTKHFSNKYHSTLLVFSIQLCSFLTNTKLECTVNVWCWIPVRVCLISYFIKYYSSALHLYTYIICALYVAFIYYLYLFVNSTEGHSFLGYVKNVHVYNLCINVITFLPVLLFILFHCLSLLGLYINIYTYIFFFAFFLVWLFFFAKKKKWLCSQWSLVLNIL